MAWEAPGDTPHTNQHRHNAIARHPLPNPGPPTTRHTSTVLTDADVGLDDGGVDGLDVAVRLVGFPRGENNVRERRNDAVFVQDQNLGAVRLEHPVRRIAGNAARHRRSERPQPRRARTTRRRRAGPSHRTRDAANAASTAPQSPAQQAQPCTAEQPSHAPLDCGPANLGKARQLRLTRGRAARDLLHPANVRLGAVGQLHNRLSRVAAGWRPGVGWRRGHARRTHARMHTRGERQGTALEDRRMPR